MQPSAKETDKREEYHLSTAFTNIALNRYFGYTKTDRKWYPHLPILFDKTIMKDMFAAFEREFDLTAKHRLRAKNDMQIEFTYFNFIIENVDKIKRESNSRKSIESYIEKMKNIF